MATINPPIKPHPKYLDIYKDWKDQSKYPDKNSSPNVWGWEMLRRNPIYQNDFERSAELEKQNVLFVLPREDFYAYRNIPDHPQFYDSRDFNISDVAIVSPLQWLMSKWMLRTKYIASESSLNPLKRDPKGLLISFHRPWLPDTALYQSSEEYWKKREESVKKKRVLWMIQIYLNIILVIKARKS